MSKKILALLLVALLVVGLAACGGTPAASDKPSENPATDAPASDAGDQSPAADDGALLTKDESEAQLVVPYYGYTDDNYNAKLADYEAQGIDIKGKDNETYCDYNLVVVDLMREYFPNYKVQYVDWGWSEPLDQKNRASLTAGNPPSILVGEVYAPNYAQEGICSTLPQDLVDACYPSMLVKDANGNNVMVNTDTALFHCYVNMNIYTEAGYTEADLPTTWSKLLEQSNAITAKGAGEYWGGAIPTFPNAGGTLRTTPWLRQMGVDYGTADSVEMLSSAEAIKAFTFIRDMGKNLPAGVGDAASEDSMWAMWDDGEGNGTVCFIFDGTFRDSNNKASGINYACISLPTPDEGCVDPAANCAVGAVICGVPNTAEYQDACMNVMRVLCSYEVGSEWMDAARAVPNKQAMEDEANYASATDAFNALCEAIKAGDSLIPGLVAWQNNASSVWEIIGQKLTGPLTSTTTPIEDLVKTVQDECTPLLAKN